LPIKDTAAQLFYGQLFELDPTLRSMFKSDMVAGRKLMALDQTRLVVSRQSRPDSWDGLKRWERRVT